jgi:hypothetical protein
MANARWSMCAGVGACVLALEHVCWSIDLDVLELEPGLDSLKP